MQLAGTKIGLLWPFSVIFEGHPWWVTALICLAVTPLGMIIVGWVFELRTVPILPDHQFWGFFPGDIFLGLAAATLLTTAQAGAKRDDWYNQSPVIHVVFLSIACAVAIGMTVFEIVTHAYPLAAILSPTKLYHNGVLYAGYGYVVATSLVVCVSQQIMRFDAKLFWGGLVLGIFVLLVWAVCTFVLDNVPGLLGQVPVQKKGPLAHQADWWIRWTMIYKYITGAL